MKRLLFVLFLIFLVSCKHEQLPPSPPSLPGAGVPIGRAIGGIAISNASLPSWAAPILNTDISPTSVKPGDPLKVTVQKPSGNGAVARTVDVAMQNVAYDQAVVTITAGDSVRWTNKDSVSHTATGDTFETGTISPGLSRTITFNTPGTYEYHCDFHPGMKAKVVVLPGGSGGVFYAYGFMYVLNRASKTWEKFSVDTSKSGKISRDWVDGTAVFSIPVTKDRFTEGQNYVLVYWCIDTGKYDASENKIWNCNGNKWNLGAFEVRSGYPDVLIEQDIGSIKYKNSSKEDTADGAQYQANYEQVNGEAVPVQVMRLKNVSAYKKLLADNLALVENAWTVKGNLCGLLQAQGLSTSFTWISNDARVTVLGFSSDESRASQYAVKYTVNCRLLDELRRIGQGSQGFCGNKMVESPEQCDGTNDSACPGLCKPDCSCAVKGEKNSGVCGDFVIQQPNGQNQMETCEPPEKRDPITGQILSGSSCFVRDLVSNMVVEGHCNGVCVCEAGVGTFKKCGNGACDSDETATNCPADCPIDTTPPTVSILSPAEGEQFVAKSVNAKNMSYAGILYVVDAKDLFGVSFCELLPTSAADSPMAPPWTMMVWNGTAWRSMINASVGNQSFTAACQDKFGNKASPQVRHFLVVLPIVINLTNVTVNQTNVTGNATNGTNQTGGVGVTRLVVNIDDSSFSQINVTVARGSDVVWVNNDRLVHTATSTSGPQGFDTGVIAAKESKTVHFSTPGYYVYHCQFHGNMVGTILVT